MATQGKDGIAWTEETWSPVRGCSLASAGCQHCYAMGQAHRFSGPGQPYEGLTKMTSHGPVWTGDVRLVPEILDQPLRWKRPRRVFVTSMSDLFHEAVPDAYRDRVFAVVALSPQHVYQNLTKRPENQLRYISDPKTPFRVQQAMDAVSVDFEMSNVREEWRPVVEDHHYEVSNFGEVRRDGAVLAPVPHSGAYLQVAICTNGKPVTRLIHALVLAAFVGPNPSEDGEVAHRNGIRTDNRVANLSWTTRGGNMKDAARHGTAGAWMKGRATLTPEQVQEIRRRRANGEKLDDVARAVGSNRKQVCAVALGKIFKPAAIQWPLPNVWLGVSAEDQATADERIPLLLQTPAAVRWVSCEPLLGPIDLTKWGGVHHHPDNDVSNPAVQAIVRAARRQLGPTIDWVVVGAESGPKSRPMELAWARSLRDQCKAAGVAMFMKQICERGRKIPYESFPADLQIREYPR